MYRDGTRLVLSATDLTRHVGCAHATTLERDVALGRRPRPERDDPALQLVAALGDGHETAYLERLREQGRGVVEIPDGGSPADREARTLEAMRAGADVIYQGTLFDGAWLGHADFLVRAERPSGLGDWSYDVADTKLARHLSVTALLQMAGYADRLAELQGAPVQRLTVVAGDGAEHHWRPEDVLAYARLVRRGLEGFVAGQVATEPVPVGACGRCGWIEHCTAVWEERDDLSRVAGMRADHRQALIDGGISTVAQLAASDRADLTMLSARVRDRLHGQARVQVRERETGERVHELLAPEPGRGLQLLPEPDPGDVYLDFEGDPFAEDGDGREYLAGVWTRDGEFLDWWAHDFAEEGRLAEGLLDWLVTRWRQHPGMHVYHYAPYETTALKRMTAQHATRESELDQLLRGGRFVDLYQVVRQGLRISKPSYSIKKVEDFYWHQTRPSAQGEVSDGMASVVEYERWLAGGRTDHAVIEAIRRYNREDVRSTHALHQWLEEQRAVLAGDHELARPLPKPLEEAKDSEQIQAENAMAERLVEAGHELLAGLVGWHRREDRSAWWDYFRTAAMTVEELIEDDATVGELGEPVQVGEKDRSFIWEYRYPPQDVALKIGGEQVKDARTHQSVGALLAFDGDEGWIRVTRAKKSEPVRAEGLAQQDVVRTDALRDSLLRLGQAALAGEDVPGLRLLDRVTPRMPARQVGPSQLGEPVEESAGDLMQRVGVRLDGQVLAVQGPPGAGKSYNGARLIRSLLDAGQKVGVTAQSHRVIADLMDKVARPGVRRAPGRTTEGAVIRLATDNKQVDTALADGATFVGGTAWLWAREEMAGAVDVLVVDEAGQFSLANAAAIAQGARSLVLLGDPQQLRSPTKAAHPYGAGVSALEHLIGDHDTIDPACGVFLDRTWRMHPRITDFVSALSYESRLESQEPVTAQQVVQAPGRLTGAGLRWVPVPHTGNSSCSVEEAEVVRALVADLLTGEWTNEQGEHGPVQARDVLVVAPYNAHVATLREALPDDVQVGTVDKFQGNEGAVVIYAMGASTADDAPRGVPFLYDVHRLNVALSRARALAVVVASPDLLEAPVSTPEQLRAVNALCRFVAEAAAA